MQEIKYSDTSVATIVNGCVGQSILMASFSLPYRGVIKMLFIDKNHEKNYSTVDRTADTKPLLPRFWNRLSQTVALTLSLIHI